MTTSATLSANTVGTALARTTFQWNENDVILYALGVGARPPAETALVSEHLGPAVLPTFALLANWWAVRDLRSLLDLGTYPIVHAAQSLEMHQTLAPHGEVTVDGSVTAVWDKGKHAAIEVTTRGHDASGALFTAVGQTMVLGAGGFGGTRGPAAREDPPGPPDVTYDDVIRPEQAAVYRLSGDRNPLHIDPAAAQRAGFADVFLHGLCTFGFAARALINQVGGGNPDRLRSISCRFAKPVALDTELCTEIWRDERGTVRFRTMQDNGGDSVVALSSGSATMTGL
ncbi:Uncharacterised protein [Mycolicibacterium vanbaalenii]|uniref:MaoC domain protein dehydratase n=1 Tax=Mycolicibacterium vanbaalenii TaxID=110539 RepID=A0A5S9MRE9_MYCVN|nr:MaoC/PaaZ C-terminal domain-containing protein [Mycolicibacterium vanbaalenii]CAA0079331.1 Uncharacterised protein [Mycolicibacterium vanbaalenii]